MGVWSHIIMYTHPLPVLINDRQWQGLPVNGEIHWFRYCHSLRKSVSLDQKFILESLDL